MTVLATVVDWHGLLQVIWVGAAAGIAVPAAFGVALLGVTRASDFSRDGRVAEAVLYGAMGIVGLLAVAAAVVYGVVVMTHK
jgi:H+/Cl- antiporter ClcA